MVNPNAPGANWRHSAQRRSDSPLLWVALAGGSLVLHMALLIGLRQYWTRTASLKASPAPISVEFVRSPAAQKSTTSAPGTPRLIGEQPAAVARSQTLKRQTATVESNVQPPPAQLQRSTPPAPVQQPREPKRPASPSTRNPNLAQPRAVGSGQPIPGQPPAPDPQSSSAAGNAQVPGAATNDSGLQSVEVSRDRKPGQGLNARIIDSRGANNGRDIPDSEASPLTKSQPFPEIPYPSSVALNLGSRIKLQALIDQDGNAGNVQVIAGSQTKDYDDLAITLLQRMKFAPALQAGKPVASLVELEFQIDALK